MASEMNLLSGGYMFPARWVKCEVLISKKQDEYIVSFPNLPGTVTPPAFFVQPELVQLEGSPVTGETSAGRVKVILLEDRVEDDSVVVEVPGEPVSYGPKLVVPSSLLA